MGEDAQGQLHDGAVPGLKGGHQPGQERIEQGQHLRGAPSQSPPLQAPLHQAQGKVQQQVLVPGGRLRRQLLLIRLCGNEGGVLRLETGNPKNQDTRLLTHPQSLTDLPTTRVEHSMNNNRQRMLLSNAVRQIGGAVKDPCTCSCMHP